MAPTPASSSIPRRASPRTAITAAALLVLPILAGCSQEQPSSNQSSASPPAAVSGTGAVVAKVNGVEIREGDITLASEDLSDELRMLPSDQQREQAIAYLTDIILVSLTPDSQKVATGENFQRRVAFMRNKLLMGALLANVGREAQTDEAMRKVYDDAVKSMKQEEEVRARHILVETEEEANELATQLRGGADFATVAKEKSKDPSAGEGGDLGYFTKDQMVTEFADVAFKMFPGQMSNPIKTQFGWHIIKLEDKRAKPIPTFDQVKDQIETFVTRKAQTEYVAKLRETAKIERLDKPGAGVVTPQTVSPDKK